MDLLTITPCTNPSTPGISAVSLIHTYHIYNHEIPHNNNMGTVSVLYVEERRKCTITYPDLSFAKRKNDTTKRPRAYPCHHFSSYLSNVMVQVDAFEFIKWCTIFATWPSFVTSCWVPSISYSGLAQTVHQHG